MKKLIAKVLEHFDKYGQETEVKRIAEIAMRYSTKDLEAAKTWARKNLTSLGVGDEFEYSQRIKVINKHWKVTSKGFYPYYK